MILRINNASAITNLSHIDIAVFSLSGAFVKSDSVTINFDLLFKITFCDD